MKYYQYITKDKTSPEEEFWVCEDCRKLNSNLILEGRWRLIGRKETDDMACDECRRGEHQKTTGDCTCAGDSQIPKRHNSM